VEKYNIVLQVYGTKYPREKWWKKWKKQQYLHREEHQYLHREEHQHQEAEHLHREEHQHQEAEHLHREEHQHQEEIRRIPRELIEHEEQWQIIQYCQQEQLQVLLQEQQFQEIEYD